MIPNASVAQPQLLVSVQTAYEARLAQRLGVPWIDLKNPALGSLGCPDTTTAVEVLRTLAEDARASPCRTSVALGELHALDVRTADELMQLFPVVKVGLAGFEGEPCKADARPSGRPAAVGAELRRAVDKVMHLQRRSGQLVLAAYADYQRAVAPSPRAVIELARQFESRFVLVDTCVKDGLGLFHWLTPRQVGELRQLSAAFGAQLVVAGSLRLEDQLKLSEAAPDIIGVRGGVCTDGRTSELCPERIAQWLNWTRTNSSLAET